MAKVEVIGTIATTLLTLVISYRYATLQSHQPTVASELVPTRCSPAPVVRIAAINGTAGSEALLVIPERSLATRLANIIR